MKKIKLNSLSIVLYCIGLILAIGLFVEILLASLVSSVTTAATIAAIVTAVLLIMYCVCVGFLMAKQNAIRKKESASKVETVNVTDYLNIDENEG